MSQLVLKNWIKKLSISINELKSGQDKSVNFPSTQDDPFQYLSTEFEQSQILKVSFDGQLHLFVKSVQVRFFEVLQSSSEMHDNVE
ncbi:hypothetical protein BpHYR1_038764 [Brachionus plicatilis]|uniref:Uncharacterized protein n=1 Tax=Brachionus plicatilis TaxID=10195 RepID=A0A3M7S6Y0_BRAPC|nr:hypothetical protein BpHYR1_038764 [Brachionus plicatilis]